MINNKFWGLMLVCAAFASCEEVGPTINFADVQPDPDDTTYMVSPVPAAEERNVFVEEFTGVSCPNCPAGHQIIKSAETSTNGHLVAVAYYKTGMPLTAPRATTDDDFRLQLANDIDGAIFGAGAGVLPIAGVDRTVVNSKILFDRNLWATYIANRRAVAPKANLSLVSTYDASAKTVKVKATTTFTAPVDKKVYITIGMYQDSIIDAQEDQLLGDIEDYQHDHVFRRMVTPNAENGVELGTTGIYEEGRVYVRSFTATVDDPRYVPEHCRIFAIVHYLDGTSKEVLQAAEVHMK